MITPKAEPPPPATRPVGEEYDSFLVCDVEGTCERIEGEFGRLAFSYPNEIIEFPCVLLQWVRVPMPRAEAEEVEEEGEDGSTDDESSEGASEQEEDREGDNESFKWMLEIVDEFHSFVKPTWRPQLSSFCTELTGINQSDVDSAPDYPSLLAHFRSSFISKHALFTRENRTVWVTDGPWDLRDFIAKASYINKIDRPSWLAGPVIDLKLLASGYFSAQNKLKSLAQRSDSPPFQIVPPSSRLGDPIDLSPPPPPKTPPKLSTVKAFGALESPPPSRPSTPLSPQAKPFTSSATTVPAPTPPPTTRPPPTLSIPALLDSLALEPFIGRQHSGQDDARNAARILMELSVRGWKLLGNRVVPEGGRGAKERRWGWMRFVGKAGGGVPTGVVDWEEFLRKEKARLSRQ